jgi:hypothetical protein
MSAASAAAALLVALGVGGWLLSQAGGEADPKSAATSSVLASGRADAQTKSANPTPAAAGAENSLSAGSAAAADRASGGGATTHQIYNAGDIGDYSHTGPIVERYRAYVTGASTEGSYMATTPCPAPDDQSVVWHAELTYNGIEAYARVLVKSQSDRLLQVLSRADCALVESQAI